jgi:hypothetical protein
MRARHHHSVHLQLCNILRTNGLIEAYAPAFVRFI